MDTHALAELMRSREETTSRELSSTLAAAQRLNARVTVLRGRLTKRPSTPLSALDDKLRALELRRVTSSLTLQEEKALLKEIDRVKASKKEHALVDAERAEIDALKRKADAAFDKVGLMRDSLSELRTASRTLQLCVQIQDLQGPDAGVSVMPNDLETRTLDVPDPSVLGQIIGRGGANIKRFRGKHGVVFDTVDEDGVTVAIKLTGLPASLEPAMAELRGIINAVTKETSVSTEVLNALMMDRARRLHQLQDRWAVQVEPARPSGTGGTGGGRRPGRGGRGGRDGRDGRDAAVAGGGGGDASKPDRVKVTVRGGEDAVDACIAELATFETQAGEVECASEFVSAVVGSKAVRLIELQNEFGAYVSIDRDAAVFRVFHEDPAQISACAAKLAELVEEYLGPRPLSEFPCHPSDPFEFLRRGDADYDPSDTFECSRFGGETGGPDFYDGRRGGRGSGHGQMFVEHDSEDSEIMVCALTTSGSLGVHELMDLAGYDIDCPY